MKFTLHEGKGQEHDGYLESEDEVDIVKISPEVLAQTFKTSLWDEINEICGTAIDAYEGVWIDSSELTKIATLIRQHANEEQSATSDYAGFLARAAEMLERAANRRVRVMFSF